MRFIYIFSSRYSRIFINKQIPGRKVNPRYGKFAGTSFSTLDVFLNISFVRLIVQNVLSLRIQTQEKISTSGPLDISKDSVKSRWKEITGYFFFLFFVIQPCVEMGDSAR